MSGEMNKIDANSPGTAIYTSGIGGTSKFEIIGDQIMPTARQDRRLVITPSAQNDSD